MVHISYFVNDRIYILNHSTLDCEVHLQTPFYDSGVLLSDASYCFSFSNTVAPVAIDTLHC